MIRIELEQVELSEAEVTERDRQLRVARQQLEGDEKLVYRFKPEDPWESGPPDEIKNAFDQGAVAVFQTTHQRMVPVFPGGEGGQ